ncbi:hypothetical protein ANCCAN_19395 [Ancylostoma caninum]|uniref:Uncharacterized protein n=1 Tax=Ancylostoma caninum TaxID=29170 RepID=A0A368FWU7_ANCCA|nr:hypothetical protein ANCCAN_19395 [Ancylostoma caninum]
MKALHILFVAVLDVALLQANPQCPKPLGDDFIWTLDVVHKELRPKEPVFDTDLKFEALLGSFGDQFIKPSRGVVKFEGKYNGKNLVEILSSSIYNTSYQRQITFPDWTNYGCYMDIESDCTAKGLCLYDTKQVFPSSLIYLAVKLLNFV